MREWLTVFFLILGALFSLIASVGVLRMPDIFTRMHASAKSGTLGMGLILTAVAIHFNDAGVSVIALSTISFLILTAPIAAHIIARAAYFTGVPLWKGSVIDELRDQYKTHQKNPLEGRSRPEESQEENNGNES